MTGLKLLNFLLMTFVVAACTGTADVIQKHEPDIRASKSVLPAGESPSAMPSPQIERWDREMNTSPLATLVRVAAITLDPRRIADPASLTSRSIQDELIRFNHYLLQASAPIRATKDFKDILRRYAAGLETQCTTNRDSCVGLRYFHLAANSSQVAKMIARDQPEHYYRMIYFGLELKNHEWDGELVQMLFQRPIENINDIETLYADQARSLLTSSIQLAQKNMKSAKETRDFMEGIHAWRLLGKTDLRLGEPMESALTGMMAKAGMLYRADGSLHPELSERISMMEAGSNSILWQQRRLRQQTIFRPEAVGVKYLGAIDETYFLLEQVYAFQMTPTEAAELFASSKRSGQELQEATENYVRIRFLLALYDSSFAAQKIFGNQSVKTEDLLGHMMHESGLIANIWAAFMSQVSPLRTFAVLALNARNDRSAATDELNLFFNSLDRSIKLASVYPQMMVLFHKLSQKSFKIRFDSQDNYFDTTDLMANLFSGSLRVLLRYSVDRRAANEFEVLQAFDMAVRTGLFSVVQIDVDYFIWDTLNRIDGPVMSEITTATSAIDQRLRQSKTALQFKSICEEFKGARPLPRSYYFAEIARSPFMGSLADAIALPADRAYEHFNGVNHTEKEQGINYFDRRFANEAEQARLEVGRHLRIGEAMLTSYRLALKAQGKSPAEIEKLTTRTVQILATMRHTRLAVLDQAKRLHEEIGFCYWKALQRDQKIEMALLEKEKDYLRQVHRDLLRLHAGTATPEEQARWQTYSGFANMPNDFKGEDSLTPAGYRYTQIDLLIRFAGFLRQGLRTPSEVLLPPGQLLTDFGRELDNDVALVRETKSGLLAYTESETEFVNNGIKTIFLARNAFLDWYDNASQRISAADQFFKAMTSLFRLEREFRGANRDFTANDILAGQKDLLGILRLSPTDREVMQTIHLQYKYTLAEGLDGILVRYYVADKRFDRLGLFDFPTTFMERGELGDLVESEAANASIEDQSIKGAQRLKATAPTIPHSVFATGPRYYDARAERIRGRLVIPYNRELDLEMDNTVGTFIRGELSAIADFHQSVIKESSRIVELPVEQRPVGDIDLFSSVEWPLSESLIPTFERKVRDFHTATQSCFANAAPCSDFK